MTSLSNALLCILSMIFLLLVSSEAKKLKKTFRGGAKIGATPGGIPCTATLNAFGAKIDAIVAFMKGQNDSEEFTCSDPTDFDVNFIGLSGKSCVQLNKGAKAIYLNNQPANRMIVRMLTNPDGIVATQGGTVVVDTDVLAEDPTLITGIIIHELGHSCLEKRGMTNDEPNAISMEVQNILQAPDGIMTAGEKKVYFENAAVAGRWCGMTDLVNLIYTPTSGYVNPC